MPFFYLLERDSDVVARMGGCREVVVISQRLAETHLEVQDYRAAGAKYVVS